MNARRGVNWELILVLVICAIAWGLALSACCHAGNIPSAAQQHRRTLTREARVQWGLDAPVATFAAQIHQESMWHENATSHAGAQGLAQFMPATARWLPQVAPETGEPMPFSASWSIRAMVTYDRWLWKRISARTDCDRMAMTLSAYNGGLGWLGRDKAMAAAAGMDPQRWTHVALFNSGRSQANFRENRGYPTRILGVLTNLYRAAGWGRGSCDE